MPRTSPSPRGSPSILTAISTWPTAPRAASSASAPRPPRRPPPPPPAGASAPTGGPRGRTPRPAEVLIVHDALAPTLGFQAPPAGAHVRGEVSVQAQAADAGAGVATLALTVDGQTLAAAITPALPAEAATATATWTTTGLADGAQTLGATATDQAGNTA